jgi:hypothetical protein
MRTLPAMDRQRWLDSSTTLGYAIAAKMGTRHCGRKVGRGGAAAARLDRELTLAKIDRHEAEIDEFDIEGTLAFAEHLVTHASRLWLEASLGQRQRLQKLFSPKGLPQRRGRAADHVVEPPLDMASRMRSASRRGG